MAGEPSQVPKYTPTTADGTPLYTGTTLNTSGGGGGAATIADGADITQGAVADAAVVTDANGTVSAKLRGLVTLLASVITSGRIKTTPLTSAAGANSSVANATSDGAILASNTARKGATIFNDDTAGSGATLKIALGFTSSATAFTYAIPPQGYYEVPYSFTGTINGIASAATGSARITEFT